MQKATLLFVVFLFSSSWNYAQNPQPKNNVPNLNLKQNIVIPKGILSEFFRRMESHRNSLKSLRADIKMTRQSFGLTQGENSEGRLIYLSNKNENSMFRIDWTKPNHKVLIISGGKYLLYDPQFKKSKTGNSSDKVNPFAFFNMSKEKFEANFIVKYLGEDKLSDGTMTWHLELTPKVVNNYKSVELWIDRNAIVLQVKIIENSNNYSLISLKNLKKNVLVSELEFTLKLPDETAFIKK